MLRYGVASEGYLFSRDGGRTFRAMCSQAITPDAQGADKLTRISGQSIPSTAATLIDHQGRLLLGHLDALWSDDGSGCRWSREPTLDEKWTSSLESDPSDPNALLAIVTTTTNPGVNAEAVSELWRRDASGSWSVRGPIKPHAPTQRVYGDGLIAVRTTTGARLYAGVFSSLGPISAETEEQKTILFSDDLGQTWQEGAPLAAQQLYLSLLAADPLNPDRVLAAIREDGVLDALLLSEDRGATFAPYAELHEVSSITFGPDGRVYIGDAGDSSSETSMGGVWTAAQLGQPLTQIAGTSQIDCLEYDAASSLLYACRRDKFGMLDPISGAFEERVRLEDVAELLDCSEAGLDTHAVCETQLNGGSSWCCAGHYPFTPFCGDYDVTRSGNRSVLCGLSGRAYDEMAGNGPSRRDAGVSEATDAASAPGEPESDPGTTPPTAPPASAPDGAPTAMEPAPAAPVAVRDAAAEPRPGANSFDAGARGGSSPSVDAGRSRPNAPDEPEPRGGGGCSVRPQAGGAAIPNAASWLALALLARHARRRARPSAQRTRLTSVPMM